ncbi:MAG: 50S ribosome-binding GTPase [Planctomycetota bacterium]|nr:50S ribosome-binding GTPase [Planctomycetota bacterium]MDA1214707.1 50S ribosome-binding GTPase [Planctomycetota bacterium]
MRPILSQHFQPRGDRDLFGTIGEIRYGKWGIDRAEDVVVCHVDEMSWEIHCHGGFVASQRILTDLEASGVTVVPWHELFAVEAGTLEAEFRQLLSKTTTLKTAEYVLRQANGLFAGEIKSLRDAIISGQNYPHCIDRLREMLRWSTFGRRLTQPANVVIAGRPNVGKSSLINALLGYTRSIVFDQPGTTRDVVTAETAFNGWPVALTDTAGIHETTNHLEQSGIERAIDKLRLADCQIILLDRSQPLHDFGRELVARFPEAIVVVHKIDLLPAWDASQFDNRLDVSSKTSEGIDYLITAMVDRLFSDLPPNEMAIPMTERHCQLMRQAFEALELNDAATATAKLTSLID